MARNYPRFLFSKVTKGKSTGAFITHTLYPRLLIRVSDNHTCEVLVLWNLAATDEEITKIVDDAERWLFGQIKAGEIKF